jgi:hypothetical protein
MKSKVDFLKKAKTKFPKELHHVLDKVAHSCPAFCCIGKLGSYVVDSVNSLAGAEGAFNFVSLPNGFGHVVVIFGRSWSFGGLPRGLLYVFISLAFRKSLLALFIYISCQRGW